MPFMTHFLGQDCFYSLRCPEQVVYLIAQLGSNNISRIVDTRFVTICYDPKNIKRERKGSDMATANRKPTFKGLKGALALVRSPEFQAELEASAELAMQDDEYLNSIQQWDVTVSDGLADHASSRS
jgi:hypothetical protein